MITNLPELLEQSRPRLQRYARYLTKDSDRASDLVQHAFLVVWQKREQWEPGDNLHALMRKIVHDQWVKGIQAKVRQKEWAENAAALAGNDSSQQVLQRRELRDVRRAIAKLAPDQREALRMAVCEELTYRQMAEALRIEPHILNSRIASARKRLRKLAGEEDRHQTKRKVSPEERARIVERLLILRDASAVARELHRSPNVTWRIARREKIELTAGNERRGYSGSGQRRSALIPSG